MMDKTASPTRFPLYRHALASLFLICFSLSATVCADESTGLTDAVPIVPNSVISGNFDTESDIDYFKIDLLTATTLTIQYRGGGYLNAELLDSAGKSVTGVTYPTGSTQLEAGRYYLKTTYWNFDMNYQFYISVDYAPFNIAPAPGETVVDMRAPKYHWTMVDGAASYQLNIAPQGFKNYYAIPVDAAKNCNAQRGECQFTPRDGYLPDAASVGWRVIAKDSTGKEMVSSDHINFTADNRYTIARPLDNFNSSRIMGHCLFGSYCARTKNTSAHNGLDFMKASGSAVYAICDGVVKVAKPASTKILNRFTVVEHVCKGITGKLYAYYGHITPDASVIEGAKVTKGQKIGLVGSFKSGGYDNSHLHLGLATKYFSNGWGYVDIGKATDSDCKKASVTTRQDALLAKGWIDPASFGSAVGWGELFLQGGAAGNCNAPKQVERAYPVGNLLPYYPFR